MAVVCPTVTANDPHQYREQIERIASFALRIHLDFMDGVFVKATSPELKQFWWPHSIPADIHMMCQRPADYIEDILSLKPSLVIVHAEAKGEFGAFATQLHKAGIKVGAALLRETAPSVIKPGLEHIDHVLIFSGDLGHFGGHVDFSLLDKVKELKRMKPALEIGWDGGINDQNAKQLATNGVDVLNIGGYIQKANNPKTNFETLQRTVVA